jgi:hypothetical protein
MTIFTDYQYENNVSSRNVLSKGQGKPYKFAKFAAPSRARCIYPMSNAQTELHNEHAISDSGRAAIHERAGAGRSASDLRSASLNVPWGFPTAHSVHSHPQKYINVPWL